MNLKVNYLWEKEIEIFEYFQKTGKLSEDELKKVDLSIPVEKKNSEMRMVQFEREWEKMENKYLAVVNDFYDTDFEYTNITAFLSRVPRYPYERNWFAIPFSDLEQQIHVVAHETLHLIFHGYWEERCLEMFGDTKNTKGIVYSLKEAIPEILNTKKFLDILGDKVFDKGNVEPAEQLMRKIFRNTYRKNNKLKFVEFLNELGVDGMS